MSTDRDPRFPAVIPADVSVSDIDLDTEEFYVGGERLTQSRADAMSERVACGVGRPSLTGPGRHSPVLNVRVSQSLKSRLEAVADAQQRRQSDIVRDALADYLAVH